MACRLKPQLETCYYHVMTRTAQQCFWLQDPVMKKTFLALLERFSQIFYVKVHGYVIMSDHYHLCFEINRPPFDLEDIRRRFLLHQAHLANKRIFRENDAERYYARYTDLSAFMFQINRGMAIAHNRIRGTKGHLWGGRFKSLVIEDGRHMMNVLAYIELNPVRAGIVADPTDFEFSSLGRLYRQITEAEAAETGKAAALVEHRPEDDASEMDRANPATAREEEKATKPVETRTSHPVAPAFGILKSIPAEKRALVYIALIRYLALALQDPEVVTSPVLHTAAGPQLNLEAIRDALETRAPATWRGQIYGSRPFRQKIRGEAGWPLRDRTRPRVSRLVA